MSKSKFSAEYSRFLSLLRHARESRGITQAALARLLDRDQTYVSNCESKELRAQLLAIAANICISRQITPMQLMDLWEVCGLHHEVAEHLVEEIADLEGDAYAEKLDAVETAFVIDLQNIVEVHPRGIPEVAFPIDPQCGGTS